MEDLSIKIKRQFLRSTKAKTNWTLIAVIMIAFLFVSGGLSSFLGDFELPFSLGGDQAGDGEGVNKRLQFSAIERWSGTAENAKTIAVYDDALALQETLTTASTGLIQTARTYPSGTQLYVKFTDSNSLIWYDIVVPTMGESDAEANTYNDIALSTFAIGTYTTDTLMTGATGINDAGSYNFTLTGDTPIFSYMLSNTGNDNTGLVESYDPLYNTAWETWIVVKFSGTGYENIVLGGFEQSFTLGTANYGCIRLNAQALSKWKVGSNYVYGYEGTDSNSFSLDGTGYSGTAVTMQITAYAYADPSYAQTHGGSFGNAIVTLAEQTVTLTV